VQALLVRVSRAAAAYSVQDKSPGYGLQRFPLCEGIVVMAGERAAVRLRQVVGETDRCRKAAVERGARRRGNAAEHERIRGPLQQNDMLSRCNTSETGLELQAVRVEQRDAHRNALRRLDGLAGCWWRRLGQGEAPAMVRGVVVALRLHHGCAGL